MKNVLLGLIATFALTHSDTSYAAGAPVNSGFRPKPPYYMADGSGIDAESASAVFKKMGKDVAYPLKKDNWEQVLEDLRAGTVDFIGDASIKEPEPKFVFSASYRDLEYKVLSKKSKPSAFASDAEFVAHVAKTPGLKVGFVDTVSYSGALDAFTKGTTATFVGKKSFKEIVQDLMEDKTDYAIVDAAHADCYISSSPAGNMADYNLADIKIKVARAFVFNKDRLAAQNIKLEDVNKAIEAAKADIQAAVSKPGRCVKVAAAPAK
jgi:ABC-type amino acid transport substrate-binding protein